MRHIPNQHHLLPHIPLQPTQIPLQIRAGKSTRKVLLNHLLALRRLEFVEFLGEVRVGREHGCVGRCLVDDVHDVFAGCVAGGTVAFEEGGDVFAGGGDVDGFQLARGVFVLGVDDYEGAVGGGGGAGVDAYEVSEG